MWAPHISTKEALETEVEHFVECVRTGASPVSSGYSGLKVIEILEAASQSIVDQGKPVRLEAADGPNRANQDNRLSVRPTTATKLR